MNEEKQRFSVINLNNFSFSLLFFITKSVSTQLPLRVTDPDSDRITQHLPKTQQEHPDICWLPLHRQ